MPELKDFLTKKIIINNDFDGVLCGNILKNEYGCEIVGWTNSKDRLLLKKGYKLGNTETFVDIFTLANKSIDQHILPREYSNTLNPNLLRGRFTFQNYYGKYPFSTAIFLLAMMAKEGKCITQYVFKSDKFVLGDKKFKYIDILLRADDTLYTTVCKYKENAKSWWDWIIELSNNNEVLINLKNFVYGINEKQAEEWKNSIDSYFWQNYKTNKEELAPFIEENFELNSKFLSHFSLSNDIINLEETTMRHERTIVKTMEEFDNIINNNNVFSYAFVFSPYTKDSSKKNFSFTVNDNEDENVKNNGKEE